MQKTSTMNAQKSLQMVLTTLLLILAALVMHWQEKTVQRGLVLEQVQDTVLKPVNIATHTDCCLHHALQAAEGGGGYPLGVHQISTVQVFNIEELLQNDSTRHMVVSKF